MCWNVGVASPGRSGVFFLICLSRRAGGFFFDVFFAPFPEEILDYLAHGPTIQVLTV